MTLQYFTLFHIAISIVGITSGFGFLAGLISGRLFPRWAAVYLASTIATSVTGFLFPFRGVTPGILVGIVSVVVLALACFALYVRRLKAPWGIIFIFTSVLALYLNVFVLVVQTFQKNPALVEIAPDQGGPAFAVTQGTVLVLFVWLGIVALRRFRNAPSSSN